jgi:membrane protease subunit HflK
MLVFLFKKFGLKFSDSDPRWGQGRKDGAVKDENSYAQEGKRPEEGPPDLEQLWRDFNQRINKLLGGKNTGPGGGNNNSGGGGFTPDMKGAGIGAGVVAAIVLFLWLASGFFIVQEGQTAVVLTFGKFSHTTLAGFNWRAPYPIQSNEIVNVSQVRTVEVGYRSTVKNKQAKEALMLTDDENIIDIQFAVQYKLKNPADWVFMNRDQDDTLRQVAETAIREVVGRNKMDFVLYEGREKVALDVSQLMQDILDRYRSGAQITNVTMQGVQPPEQVQTAFDDAVRAGQDRERQKNEGQAYANDVIPKARGAAFRLVQEAEAYRSRVTENAVGDASRFKQVLTEYQKAPAVTRDRMYLETMQQIYSSATKVMIDAKGGNNLLSLPLDKLVAQSVATDLANTKSAQAAAQAASSTVPQSPAPDAAQAENRLREGRSREGRDGRDREGR